MRDITNSLPLLQRLLKRTKLCIETHCWIWQGKIDDDGYGRITIGGRQLRVHRISYETFRGDIPDGYVIDHVHRCRNRRCLNPEHLESVTSRQNTLRGVHSRRVGASLPLPFEGSR